MKKTPHIRNSIFHIPYSGCEGFTLVELLVSMGVFSIIVTIALGNFITTLNTQKQVVALLNANSNASFTLEQMMREMRTGYGFGCPGVTTTIPGWGMGCNGLTALSFINAADETVVYNRGIASGPGGVRGFIQRGACTPAPCIPQMRPLTSDDVNIPYLNFNVRGIVNTDGYPSRVTIMMGVSPTMRGVSSSTQYFQTTISPREPDG